MTIMSSLTELLSASGDAAYDWDLRANRIDWFGAWEKLFGGPAPATSEVFYDLICADDRHIVFGNDDHNLNRQFRIRGPEGRLIWVHEQGSTEIENGQVVRQRSILRIVEKLPEQIAPHETHGRDTLTNCYNRTHMLAQITKAMEASRASRRPAAYLVLGIDKMSFVNEAVGMEAGDALLRGVAERLSQVMPTRAMLARVGGDMFGILLPEPLGSDFKTLAERVLQSFRDQPVVTSVTPLHITISIGGVRLPTVAKNATEAMIFAEQALHDAHQRGRNLFVEYLDSPERAQENRKLLELGERIKSAFKNDGFRLAFQPIVETSTGKVVAYEALVRMFSDDGKPIAAAAFVPAIEQLGLAFELDSRVLDLAVRELEAYPDLCLAVNVSGLTAVHADWPAHMKRMLGGRRNVAERLIIEITETAAIVDVSETRYFIDSLIELGGRVSLDDFGAGFTSIRHLRSLSLSIMKIDKDLLHNILTNAEQQHLVQALIGLAHGLKLQVVAEGVETAEVADWLHRARVDMLQGYYFGRPSLERPWLAGTKTESVSSKNTPVTGTPISLVKTDLRSATAH
jgi:diguanylate cyclase (GGDEF)-like protein